MSTIKTFSSPFLGTFFQLVAELTKETRQYVFVPFLGDFLSIVVAVDERFPTKAGFSSPFLGTFFQYKSTLENLC